MTLRKLVVSCAVLVTMVFGGAPVAAQEFRGRINGTVTDNTGAVLPGVTVTASGPALIQPQVQVTGTDGSFRFLALPPGVYEIDFDLTGFQKVQRQDVRVVINQTLTVDMQMQVATLQETVTVTGDSPIVDTSTTAMGTNFTKELLTEIPERARRVGGDGAGAGHADEHLRRRRLEHRHADRLPHLRLRHAEPDPNGRHRHDRGHQRQRRLLRLRIVRGIPGRRRRRGCGSLRGRRRAEHQRQVRRRQVQGHVLQRLPQREHAVRQRPRLPAHANTPDDNGHFTRTPLTRGNPVKKQYDINGDIGGPLVKQKAWFFFSYRLNDQYKYILGLGDETERSKLSNPYTFKGTFQVGKNNQIIGYLNKREKLQDKRGISVTVPLSAAYYQSSRNYPWKVEWTSVLGSRAFLDVLYGNWYNFFPLRPVRDFGLYDGPWTPPRQDTSTLIWSNTGGNNGYQDQKRYKPQFYTTLSYYKDGWKGSHDMRFGFDWKRDRRSLFNDQPFDIWYRDNTVNGVANSLSQVDIYNSSVTGINDVVYTSGWVNDTWKLNRRLTLNLGARFEHYVDRLARAVADPERHPALAGWTDPRYQAVHRAEDRRPGRRWRTPTRSRRRSASPTT